MAKTVTQALVGILVRQGRLSVDQPSGVAAWQKEGDPRRALTVRHLLHMTAGLDNEDGEGEGITFGSRLLFGDLSRDVVTGAADVPILFPPYAHWAYSTATSMLLADVVTRTVGGKAELLAFIERELTGPLGITTLVPEFDPKGDFLGGSDVWASAEDWARLGLLYLRGGTWDGRPIFGDGWVDFSRTAAPAPDNGKYGAHLWLNLAPKGDQFPSIPGAGLETMFMMSGAFGQYVVMCPDRDLVVVRLGDMHAVQWDDLAKGIGAVADAFAPSGAAAR
jgi:CubicO group peptidase (beta-lactamase class C family)